MTSSKRKTHTNKGRAFIFRVKAEDEGRTVRDIMKNHWGLVHHDIASAKYAPYGITVDGREVYANRALKTGETLRVFVEEKMSETTVPVEIGRASCRERV